MKKKIFSEYIKSFKFKQLFNELGWDNFNNTVPISVKESVYNLIGIAEKRGFVILHCQPDSEGQIPDKNIRLQIERKVSKQYFEHLIVYSNCGKSEQIWQLALQQENKPRQIREFHWYSHQDTDILFQRMRNLLFTLDEEDNITIIDVKQRISANFQNTEKVTKKFYTEFKNQHNKFLDFITGIDDLLPNKENSNKQWYASLMLNRLMFCYFIQKKGFLDSDVHYLRNKLTLCSEQTGENKFYNFYRSFLLELFHDGLAKPKENRKEDIPISLGKIPYLNGGLFDVHKLERDFKEIEISDDAFKSIFDFFDQWNWHLDTNVEATGKDINPDVIGYIFEKYINDRADMGAYYTKEDITNYIGQNTIIPFLFDETERLMGKQNFVDSGIWEFLKKSGDDYIYDAVKKGVPQDDDTFSDFPDEIKEGFIPAMEQTIVTESTEPHLWEIRKHWNQKAPEDIALPTETYRELIERRERYADIKRKIKNGEITQTNDLITYNLNIRQFSQDFLETTEDAAFIHQFYKALEKGTILDPTCGSGAFLFAAMNILEPLYEACIMRMEEFVAENPKKYDFFGRVSTEVNNEKHPDLQYFIYKNIILNNLYGVDIMNEAVEIAKLRLFLKLVGCVDVDLRKPNYGVEPLPDIDFNIRSGNTLVGFANEQELRSLIKKQYGIFIDDANKKIKEFDEEFKLTSQIYDRFKDCQLIINIGSVDFKRAKDDLNECLHNLNEELHRYLAETYGICPDAYSKPEKYQQAYSAWLESHEPFHWISEFYQIVVENGGFDVIIGNPPYVQYSENKFKYKLRDYETLSKGNLYGYCIERSTVITNDRSYISMIVPISLVNMPTYEKIKQLIIKNNSYFSNYSGDTNPGTMFQGVKHNLTIFIRTSKSENTNFITNFQRFYNNAREHLFTTLNYMRNNLKFKVSRKIGLRVFKAIESHKQLNYKLLSRSSSNIFMKTTSGSHYKLFFKDVPFFSIDGIKQISSSFKPLYFESELVADYLLACLNSNLFNYWWCSLSDGRNVTKREVGSFSCVIQNDEIRQKLQSLALQLMNDLQGKSKRVVYQKQKGETIYDQYKPRKSKPIIDQIDTVLAQYYGLTEEQLDFIINYDIKYRMGQEEDKHINSMVDQ